MFNLGPFKILNTDKLRTGFRAKYNLLVDKIIKDAKLSIDGVLSLITHDNSELTVDLKDSFYTIEQINELVVVPYATDTKAGRIRIGTLDEVMEGISDTVAVTPYTLAQFMMFYNARPFVAGENILAGDFVSITPVMDGETVDHYVVMKSIATSQAGLVDGFAAEEAEEGEEIPVKFSGSINIELGGLVPHSWYYLSDEPTDIDNPFQIVLNPPSDAGTWRQIVGYAVSEEELKVELHMGDLNLGDVFEDLPRLVFVEGVEMTVELNLEDYLIEGIDPETLSYNFKGVPAWVSETSVVFNNLRFTGQSDEVGIVYVDMEVSSGTSKVVVLLIVETVERLTVTFIIDPPNRELIAGIVNIVPLHLSETTITGDINGSFDAFRLYIESGGTFYDTGITDVSIPNPVELIKTDFPNGLYVIGLDLYKQTGYDNILEEPIYTVVCTEIRNFLVGENLGEGDTDHIILATILPYNSLLSSAGSVFEYEEGGINIIVDPVGVVFEKINLTLIPKEVPFQAELVPDKTNVTGAVTNEIIDTDTGVATPNAGWRATSMPVLDGERYWVDADIFLYDGVLFVSHHLPGEIIIPSGVTTMRTNKASVSPVVERVFFDDFTLFVSPEEKGTGEFSLMIETQGGYIYQRLVSWTIKEADPEPVAPKAGLRLVDSGTSAIIGNIPLSGGVFPLPSNGFNVLCPSFSESITELSWVYEMDRGGWAIINIPLFTGRPSSAVFSLPTKLVNQLAFWNKNSLSIGSIHEQPSRHRCSFNGYKDGVLVEVVQGDFLFSNIPIGPTGPIAFLRYTVGDLGSGDQVVSFTGIEENMPESGRFYTFPTGENEFYGAMYRTHDSVALIGRVVMELNGVVVSDYTLDTPKDTLDSDDQLAVLFWTRAGDIDDPGLKNFTQTMYAADGVTVLGSESSSWTMYEADPEIKDPSDCCDDKCGVIKVNNW